MTPVFFLPLNNSPLICPFNFVLFLANGFEIFFVNVLKQELLYYHYVNPPEISVLGYSIFNEAYHQRF